MPRTREQFSEMKDERRTAILNAALPLFSLGQKVSVDLIAEKAKCSHGIVYHYFKNTDQIFEKLLKNPVYIELKSHLFSVAGSSYEKIEQILSILLDISEKRIDIICYLNMLIKERDKNSLFALFAKLVKDGQSSETIVAGEPTNLVESIFLLLKGLYLSFILEKHPVVKVPSKETVMQLLRKPTSFSRQTL